MNKLIDKQRTIDRWESITENFEEIDNTPDTSLPYDKQRNIIGNISTNQIGNTNYIFPSLLPLAIKVAAQSISLGDSSLLEAAKVKVKAINREGQINSILEDKEFKEIKLEDTEEYKEYLSSGLVSAQPMSVPKMDLLYFDYIYEAPKKEAKKKNHHRKIKNKKSSNRY